MTSYVKSKPFVGNFELKKRETNRLSSTIVRPTIAHRNKKRIFHLSVDSAEHLFRAAAGARHKRYHADSDTATCFLLHDSVRAQVCCCQLLRCNFSSILFFSRLFILSNDIRSCGYELLWNIEEKNALPLPLRAFHHVR